ncbi:hypothetical protein NFI96_025774 [Prochilodus magdalenae]|nr:hypothetical protein NFI96_025774 [Prochilodus magdalenae]
MHRLQEISLFIHALCSPDGIELQQSVKSCATPEMCIRESINLGFWKFNNNAKCCSTDLCNSEIMPALSGTPNGRRCYTCVGNDCTIPLNCEGIEDRCITVNGKTCLHINVTLCSFLF